VVVFGMKDYQQAIVLKHMTRDLGYPIKYIIAPTVREPDGLAMSSRNKYFAPDQRREALCLYYALRTARELARTVTGCAAIEKEMREVIKATCPTAEIVYIAFTELNTLEPVNSVKSNTVCSLAAVIHGVRLIDNARLR
jgi:pantoate--beta-alanine ligase